MREWRVKVGIGGGLCLNFVAGTIYISGNISVYLVSFLREKGEDVTLEDAIVLLPIQLVVSTILMYFGTYMTHKYGPRLTTMLGNGLLILATFCSSFCTTFWSFCLVYAIPFGIGGGITFVSPLIMGWSYYPQYKGRISGMTLLASALGTSVFSIVSTAIINPNNEQATVKVKNGSTTDRYYSASIADDFPAMLRWMALCYLCISAVGWLLVVPMKPIDVDSVVDYKVPEDPIRLPSVTMAVRSWQFWQLFTMGLLTSGFGTYLAAAYKSFGSDKIHDDSFLATVGSVSFFMNGVFRIVFAQLMDYASFKTNYTALLIIQIIVSASIYFVAEIKWMFLIWVSVAMGCEGANLAVFSAVCGKLFGKEKGGAVLSLLYYCFAIASLIGYVLQLFLVKEIGYIAMFFLLTASAAAGMLILLLRFKETSPWKSDSQLIPIEQLSATDMSPRQISSK